MPALGFVSAFIKIPYAFAIVPDECVADHVIDCPVIFSAEDETVLFISMDLKVGEAVVCISCGVLRVIELEPFVTVILFEVPVMLAHATLKLEDINIWPFPELPIIEGTPDAFVTKDPLLAVVSPEIVFVAEEYNN